jgi:hypothetical protein
MDRAGGTCLSCTDAAKKGLRGACVFARQQQIIMFVRQNAHIDIHANGDDRHVVVRVTKIANPNKMLLLNYVKGTHDAFAIECTDVGLAEYMGDCLENNAVLGPYIVNTNFGLRKKGTTLDEMMLFVKDCVDKMIHMDVLWSAQKQT